MSRKRPAPPPPSPVERRRASASAAVNLMEDAVQSRQAMERLNAELRESERALAAQLEDAQRLQSLSAQLVQTADPDALYEMVLDTAIGIMRTDRGLMQVLDENEDALRVLSLRGFDPEFGQVFEISRPDDKTACSLARLRGERAVIPDVEASDFFAGAPALDVFRKAGVRALQSTPLYARDGQLIGMVTTYWRERHEPNERELRMLDVVARQAADLIERTKAAEALSESERRFREMHRDLQTIYDITPVGMCLLDRDLRYVHINDALAAMNGIPAKDHIGKTVREMVPHIADEIEPAFRRVLETGEAVFDIELTGQTRAQPGVVRTWLESWYPMRDASDQIVGVNVVAIEITDRKRAEDLLLHSERTQRLLAQMGVAESDVGAGIDREGRIHRICEMVATELQVSRCGLARVDLDAGEVTVEASAQVSLPPLAGSFAIANYSAHLVEDAVAGRTTVMPDLATDPRTSPVYEGTYRPLSIRAHINVPLHRDGRWVANFWVAHHEPRQWSDSDVALMRALGERIWLIVEQIRGAAALRESEERYRSLTQAITSVVWTVDADGRFVKPQPSWAAYTGQTWEQLRDFGWADALHPDDRERVRELWEAARAARTLYKSDGRLWHAASGSYRHFEASAVPILSGDGSVREWVGTCLDTEDRNRAVESVRRQADQFQTLLNEVPLGCYVIDGDFRIRHVNPSTFQVFGEVPNLIGRDFDEVIHILWPEAYADEIVRLFRHTLETGEPYVTPERIEERLDRGVTEIYEWQINRIPLPESGYGVVCYFREISAQVQARAAIADSERRLRFVMDSAPQKIFTAKPNGDVDYFNPIWTEFTGLSFEQIRDWGWTQFIHPDDVEENVRVWRQSIGSGEPFQFEHRFRRADGEYRWHVSRAIPMRDAEGRIVMWIGSNTDIDEQKQAANTLRHYAAELAQSDRRKTEFLAMLAHELRNPLAPIRNAVNVVRMAEGNWPAIQSATEMIERQVGHLVRLVEQLLDVSRISIGKIRLRKEPVDVASVATDALETVRALLDRREQELTVTLPEHPVHLHADPTRLVQVLGNLLNNASKFTAKGGSIWLDITAHDDTCVIRVRDNGIGIAPDQISRIFEMFTQLDTSLERTVGGLGIGLTLVKSLVEMHGGTVEVHSAGLGQGSEFVVHLPVVPADTPSQTPPEASVAYPS